MAILEILKQRIVALSPGKFQNLCDAYLNENGYKNMLSLGSKPGTEKTTRGTPDTYCVDSGGKYIFITNNCIIKIFCYHNFYTSILFN